MGLLEWEAAWRGKGAFAFLSLGPFGDLGPFFSEITRLPWDNQRQSLSRPKTKWKSEGLAGRVEHQLDHTLNARSADHMPLTNWSTIPHKHQEGLAGRVEHQLDHTLNARSADHMPLTNWSTIPHKHQEGLAGRVEHQLDHTLNAQAPAPHVIDQLVQNFQNDLPAQIRSRGGMLPRGGLGW